MSACSPIVAVRSSLILTLPKVTMASKIAVMMYVACSRVSTHESVNTAPIPVRRRGSCTQTLDQESRPRWPDHVMPAKQEHRARGATRTMVYVVFAKTRTTNAGTSTGRHESSTRARMPCERHAQTRGQCASPCGGGSGQAFTLPGGRGRACRSPWPRPSGWHQSRRAPVQARSSM
jgi:hypothetical protein